MAKKKRNQPPDRPEATPANIKPLPLAKHSALSAGGAYTVITVLLTFPLVLRMNSSIYGPYDHVTTDLFTSIYLYFWWLKTAVVNLHTSPFLNPFLAAPFAAEMTYPNFTGFPHLPLSIFGAVFSRNFAILFNLAAAGLGMFFLVRHLTKNAAAAFIAGLIYAFCPNMLVRSYTTFDSTQVQWIPFYTLYVLKFLEHRTWRNIIPAGVFLVCHILFAFPYYLVYLPVHTIVLMLAYGIWRMRSTGQPAGAFLKDLFTPEALKAWLKVITVVGAAFIIFLGYYVTVVGGGQQMSSFSKTTQQLEELALAPTDYVMPHPRSTLLKANVKQAYWDTHRPGKNPDSFVAYTGFIAIALMILGIVKGRGAARWCFIAGGIVAFWSTLGPTLFGLPTPSGFIHAVYAPFARRILIYKVFVQFSVAGLAGMGLAWLLQRLNAASKAGIITAVLAVCILGEYLIVPPALSVDLRRSPEIYEKVKALPDDTILLEVPQRRYNGNSYQGYLFYQTVHGRKLFNNPMMSPTTFPEHMQPLYRQMDVPMEAAAWCNLAALRYIGVTHISYHWHIGTKTVRFGAFGAPAFLTGEIEGLNPVYICGSDPFRSQFQGPYDYEFADLYEITAEPCPVALTFDYHSPYDKIADAMKQDFLLPDPKTYEKNGVPIQPVYGWVSALTDPEASFYFPMPGTDAIDRVVRDDGRMTLTNLSNAPVEFTVSFNAKAGESERSLEALWNDNEVIGSYRIGTDTSACSLEPIRLEAGAQGVVTFRADDEPFPYQLTGGHIPAEAVLGNFRVLMKNQ